MFQNPCTATGTKDVIITIWWVGFIVKGAYAAIADYAPRYTVQPWMVVRIVRMRWDEHNVKM